MEDRWQILSLHRKSRHAGVWNGGFCSALGERGEHRLIENADQWTEAERAEAIRGADILLTAWDAPPVPLSLIAEPGRLRYICHVNGEIRKIIDRAFIESGFAVSNWGPAPGRRIAEGAVALLLASLKQIPNHVVLKHGPGWIHPDPQWTGSLQGLHVGIYGFGVIGRECARLLKVFGAHLTVFDPYANEGVEGIERADSLDTLFSKCAAVVIAAGLNDQTRHSVGASLLRQLPDGGIVVNVARGAIVDQTALLAEVRQGRLRAALDVLDTDGNDWMPPEHPDRHLPHLILTGHTIGGASWNEAISGNNLSDAHTICLSNLDRFMAGQPPLYSFDLTRYDRST
jgi:phosphoglycerate dehydrogenase-like enzyme